MSTYYLLFLMATMATASALSIESVSSAVCATVQSLMGISFTKMFNKNEELNVDDLTIQFFSGDFKKTYNMTTAAKDILTDNKCQTNLPLYVFLHGWNSDTAGSNGITDALNAKGHNVMALDSSKYMKSWNYMKSSVYVMFIGKKLAQVLAGLVQVGMDRKNIHIIGHSLGAHMAGFAGITFRNLTGHNIGRISGLDPAGPCFTRVSDDYQLTSDDADFVDIIHSSAGITGIARAIGHVDFYPNGGSRQPGCLLADCDHGRSAVFYAESIASPEAFLAVKAGSWDQFQKGEGEEAVRYMGFGASAENVTGSYYLHTASASPFSLGLNSIVASAKANLNLFQKFFNMLFG